MALDIPSIYLPNDIRRGTTEQWDESASRWAFSGADLHVYVGDVKIANMVGLTVSITREVVPLYTFGDPSPKTFVKGKRGIAGAMTFTQFDKHALLYTLRFNSRADNKDFETFDDLWDAVARASTSESEFLSQWQAKINDLKSMANRNSRDYYERVIGRTYDYVKSRKIRYVDQLPPLDMTLVFLNESGAFAWLSLIGVQFVNEGFGYTLDDLASEVAVTYVATGIVPLTSKRPTVGNQASGQQ